MLHVSEITISTCDYYIAYDAEGGDQLTAARVRGSQRVRSNSQRGIHRLEGLVPVIEDWHAKGCLLSVSTCNTTIINLG